MYKLLGPYKKIVSISDNGFEYVNWFRQTFKPSFPTYTIWNNKIGWFHNIEIPGKLSYKMHNSFEDAKLDLESHLIALGYKFLTQEDFDKLNILA